MYGYIYKTTNLINNKIYIGQHKSTTFDTTYFGSGVAILNAINKYGKENFNCTLIEWCETQSQTNSRERYWIKFYNSRDKNVGYNITEGGEGWKGGHHSLESRVKISKSKTGVSPNRDYVITNATKQKISTTLKEYFTTHENPRKGVQLSESTKQKLRKANLGKIYSKEVRLKHKRPAWNKGIPMSEEAKQHLRELNTGKKSNMSDEARKKMSERFSGKNNPNYGGLSDFTKEKIRQSISGRIWINDSVQQKQVMPETAKLYLNNGWVRGRLKIHRLT